MPNKKSVREKAQERAKRLQIATDFDSQPITGDRVLHRGDVYTFPKGMKPRRSLWGTKVLGGEKQDRSTASLRDAQDRRAEQTDRKKDR